MTKYFAALIIAIALIAAAPALAGPRLAWDEYIEQNNIVGFIVYSQEQGAVEIYAAPVSDPAAVEYPIPLDRYVPGKTYDWWVTAYNPAGESPKSNVVTWTVPAFTPPDNPPPQVVVIPGKPVTIRIE